MQPHSSDTGPAAKRVRIDLTSSTSSAGDSDEKCFVCDTTIVGKKYSLASCMTNGTKVRLVEVLGRLVSDSYMVVVSHSEHICRGCANLLNTLDRLEAEISSVKRIVLNFVERKYQLGNTLQNQLTAAPVVYSKTVPSASNPSHAIIKTTTLAARQYPAGSGTPAYKAIVPNISTKSVPVKLATPPTKPITTQIAPKPAAAATAGTSVNASSPSNPAMVTKAYKITLKDEQIMNQSKSVLQSAEQHIIGQTTTSKQPVTPRNVWMQCNQCQYTTNQRTVMLEHLRQHIAARSNTPQSKTTSTEENQASKTIHINGTPGTSKPTAKTLLITPNKDGGKPTMMLTIDGKLTQKPVGSTANKPTILLQKSTSATASTVTSVATSSPRTVTTSPSLVTSSPSAAGIVTKVLSSSSSKVSKTLCTPDTAAKVVTSTKGKVAAAKPKEPAKSSGPQTFSSSSSKSAGPDPSLPILLADDDM